MPRFLTHYPVVRALDLAAIKDGSLAKGSIAFRILGELFARATGSPNAAFLSTTDEIGTHILPFHYSQKDPDPAIFCVPLEEETVCLHILGDRSVILTIRTPGEETQKVIPWTFKTPDDFGQGTSSFHIEYSGSRPSLIYTFEDDGVVGTRSADLFAPRRTPPETKEVHEQRKAYIDRLQRDMCAIAKAFSVARPLSFSKDWITEGISHKAAVAPFAAHLSIPLKGDDPLGIARIAAAFTVQRHQRDADIAVLINGRNVTRAGHLEAPIVQIKINGLDDSRTSQCVANWLSSESLPCEPGELISQRDGRPRPLFNCRVHSNDLTNHEKIEAMRLLAPHASLS